MAKDKAGMTPAPRKTTSKKPATAKKVAGIGALEARMVAKKREPKASKPRAPDAVVLKRSICEQIADGIPLREICRQPGMPAWRTVYDWVGADEAFAAAIARAREMGHEAIAEETVEMVDAEPERGPDGKVDPGWVAYTKLRVEHRLKLLAKWSPKKYGDKVQTELTGPGGGAIAVQSTVTFVHSPRREEDD